MPNLFPDNMNFSDDTIDTSEGNTQYKGSYKFDFDKGEFIKNPDGTIAKCDGLEAYKQWCQLAIRTPVGMLGYSRLFGNELNTLIGTQYSKTAIQLEVKRMTIEALMVHPKTKDVTNFSFKWNNNGELYYEYNVTTTIDNTTFSMNNSLKVR